MFFDKVISDLKRINLGEIALEEFENSKEIAFDLNTESQLFGLGIDAEGNSLGEYAPFTIQIKQALGQPTDRITLRDTGDFHEGWFADFTRWPVVFGSRDSKTPELLAQFGAAIFGLTPENIDELLQNGLQEDIEANFASKVQKALKRV